MSQDLFSLAKETQGRSNPIVTALLYSYCPAAAHWYVRNSPVEVVFDLVWKALEDYATGKTLAECLTEYGLSTVIPEIKHFIEQVELFRRRQTHSVSAPETTMLFMRGKRADSTFGLQSQMEPLGGSWNNVLEYARIWAFVMRDWKASMKLRSGESIRREFKKFTVSLSAPGVHSRLRVHLPVWGWEVTVGKVKSVYLGLLVSRCKQDALRFALVHNSDLVGDKPWPGGQRPYLYGLDRVSGEAEYMNLAVDLEYALNMVMPIYRAARIGPNFPMAALHDRDHCLACGYRKICFGEKNNSLLVASLNQLLHESKREREFLTGFVGADQTEFEEVANEEAN